MLGSPSQSLRDSKWLLVLLVAAVAAIVWALLAWEHVWRAEETVAEQTEELPRILERAKELQKLRAERSGPETLDGRVSRQDLIPFLESAAAKARIMKEALQIDPEDPKPLPGRPGLTERRTRVVFEAVSARSLVDFLSLAERDFPQLEVREILLSPSTEGQAWYARVVLSVVSRAGEGS